MSEPGAVRKRRCLKPQVCSQHDRRSRDLISAAGEDCYCQNELSAFCLVQTVQIAGVKLVKKVQMTLCIWNLIVLQER